VAGRDGRGRARGGPTGSGAFSRSSGQRMHSRPDGVPPRSPPARTGDRVEHEKTRRQAGARLAPRAWHGVHCPSGGRRATHPLREAGRRGGMADAEVSKTSARKGVWVQLPPPAPPSNPFQSRPTAFPPLSNWWPMIQCGGGLTPTSTKHSTIMRLLHDEMCEADVDAKDIYPYLLGQPLECYVASLTVVPVPHQQWTRGVPAESQRRTTPSAVVLPSTHLASALQWTTSTNYEHR